MTTDRDMALALNIATGANFQLSPPIVYGGVSNWPISVSALVNAGFLKRHSAFSKDGGDRNYAYTNVSLMNLRIEGELLPPGACFHDSPYPTLW